MNIHFRSSPAGKESYLKRSNDYDNVFKTMKLKTKRLFIPVINNIFDRNYSFDESITVLSSESAYVDESPDGKITEPHQLESDYRIRIGQATYLLECQSYDDNTIQIRITEYAFLSSIDEAEYGPGWAHIKMPHIAIIYIKCREGLPDTTDIRLDFPGDITVVYSAKNIFLQDLSKEYIADNRLYPYIPFYITRYEKELSRRILPEAAIRDLEFFKDRILNDFNGHMIDQREVIILLGFVNKIITHITDGNELEERLVNIMGGVVIETLYDKAINEGKAIGLEQGIERGYNLRDRDKIREMLSNGKKPREIVEFCNYPAELVSEVQESLKNA